MKHAAIAALLVAAAGAQAQSSVTMFGVVDLSYSRGTGSVMDRTQINSGSNSTSRIGLRGVEDLGGGLSASFWLEAGFTADNGLGQSTNTNNQTSGNTAAGGLAFNRRSTLSLEAPWGEVRAGRDHVAHYRSRLEVDPFANVGVGAIQPHVGTLGGNTSTRVSNFVGYYLPPNIGGFYGFVQYYLGENANGGATADDGNGASIRLGYDAGPLNLSVATGRTAYARTATTGDVRSSNIGVQYKLGDARLLFGYFVDKVDSVAPVTGKGASIGAIVPLGAHEIKAAWSYYGSDTGTSPKTKKLSLGYVHNLSKRSALYATIARVGNRGGATTALNSAVTGPNQASSGWDIGLRHSF